jgi:predicted DNA-binding transcriptional regulator YafY
MSDQTALRRHLILLSALSARRLTGLTLREMADEAGVNDKTIRRDLDLFRSVGFPVEETTGDCGRKDLAPERRPFAVPLGVRFR